jgi:hypothetical protein
VGHFTKLSVARLCGAEWYDGRLTLWRPNFFTVLYKNSVRTSQETHYVSTTKPNRLMLFGETVPVYCENHMEHTNTLCEQNAEFWYSYVKERGTYSNHWVNWRGFGRKRSWRNQSTVPALLWRDWGKVQNTCQDSWCVRRHSIRAVPEYEWEALSLEPTCAVILSSMKTAGVGHVARMGGEEECIYGSGGNPEERDH